MLILCTIFQDLLLALNHNEQGVIKSIFNGSEKQSINVKNGTVNILEHIGAFYHWEMCAAHFLNFLSGIVPSYSYCEWHQL